MSASTPKESEKGRALDVFLAFLRMGFFGFGGPLAHTAMFEEEFVRKREWISRKRFLERMSLTQLIPGPNSTELAMQIGYARAGWKGFFLAGLAFLLPAVFMVSGLAVLHRIAGNFGNTERWLWGTKPVVFAMIVIMLFHSTRTILKLTKKLIPISVGFLLVLLGQPSPSALAISGGIWLILEKKFSKGAFFLLLAALPYLHLTYSPPTREASLTALFVEMLYLGSMVIGSGYVLFSYFSLRLVEELRWVNAQTLALAIAAGQLTPGPLFASAAFFGQSLHGFQGAMLASMGIFLPAFIFSAAAIPLSQRLEFKTWWKDCLEVMSAVAILLMGRETIRLLPFFLERHAAYGLFAAALVASTRFQVNSSLLIVLGSLAGYLLF